MTEAPNKVTLLTDKINTEVAGGIAVEPSLGGVALADIREVMELSKLMAVSGFAVPSHLQGQQGACFAICMYALEWRMSPFAVANKSYVVNNRLAFESQLVHAVIEQRAPIRGRVKHEFIGDGPTLQCRVYAILRETDEELSWTGPEIGKIKTKNSPEWVNNPPKQLYYHAMRDFARVYFPDVILGVYTDDEMRNFGPENAKDVSPPSPNLLDRLPGRTEGAGFQPDVVEQAAQEHEAVERATTLREQRKANIAKRIAAKKSKVKGRARTPVESRTTAQSEPEASPTHSEPALTGEAASAAKGQ